MSEKPISPLRQRMIEDMTVRNFVEKTRNDYNATAPPRGLPVQSWPPVAKLLTSVCGDTHFQTTDGKFCQRCCAYFRRKTSKVREKRARTSRSEPERTTFSDASQRSKLLVSPEDNPKLAASEALISFSYLISGRVCTR